MWKNKKTQKFIDGEVTSYFFANGNYIMLKIYYVKNLCRCEVGWKFGNLEKNVIGDTILNNLGKYYKIQIEELFNIYNSLKKHKNKTKDKILLLSALQIVIHDLKEQIFIEQKLF